MVGWEDLLWKEPIHFVYDVRLYLMKVDSFALTCSFWYRVCCLCRVSSTVLVHCSSLIQWLQRLALLINIGFRRQSNVHLRGSEAADCCPFISRCLNDSSLSLHLFPQYPQFYDIKSCGALCILLILYLLLYAVILHPIKNMLSALLLIWMHISASALWFWRLWPTWTTL